MTSINKKRLGLVLLTVLVTVALGVGYVVFKSNTEGNEPVIEQETRVTQPEKKAEVKQEDVATGTTIKAGDSEFGPILFDGRGQAIYIWELEKSTKAECYDDCAKAWPPVLTSGSPIASSGINNDLLGTTKRTDGTTQVTYNGHPLYYYANEKVGEVKCHNVRTHGGLWWVIQPNGARVN